MIRYCKRLIMMGLLSKIFIDSALAGNYNYPSGSRSAALAHSSVMLCDTWSSFNNQAGLAYLKRPSASFYFENKYMLKELSVKSGALAIPFKLATIGLSLRNFGYSKYYESKAGLALSRCFTDRFAVGVQLDMHQTHLAESYGDYNSLNAEIGLMAKPTNDLIIGFQLFNPFKIRENALPEERLPTIIRLGLGYSFGKATLLLETEKDLKQEAIFKAGVEVEAIRSFFVRGGYSSGYDEYSFGIGYKWHGALVDIAFARHAILGFSPTASLGYDF